MSEVGISIDDLIGDLHGHSERRDEGRSGSWDSTIKPEDVINWVGQGNLGIQYFTLAQHAEGFAGDNQLESFYDQPDLLDVERQRVAELNQLNPKVKVVLGVEASIRADGSVNVSEEVLDGAELVIASIHSGSKNDPTDTTKRILTAMDSDHVDIIGHIGRNDPSWTEIDWLKIGQKAAHLDKAVEVSMQPAAHHSVKGESRERTPSRQLEVLKTLYESGAKISIGTDIHHSPEIAEGNKLKFGQVRDLVELVQDLNSVGFTKDRVLNTYSYQQLLDWARANNHPNG